MLLFSCLFFLFLYVLAFFTLRGVFLEFILTPTLAFPVYLNYPEELVNFRLLLCPHHSIFSQSIGFINYPNLKEV